MISSNLFSKETYVQSWPSWMRHQANGFSHVDEEIQSILNKNKSPMTSVWEDSSIEPPQPNIFSSSFGLATSTTSTINVVAIGVQSIKAHH
jgi:hypothetical protein